jgi:hypothetical protein
MHRNLLRAVLAIALPLLLTACRDNADPVKPKIAHLAMAAPVA